MRSRSQRRSASPQVRKSASAQIRNSASLQVNISYIIILILVYIYIYVHVSLYIYMFICVYIFVYIYMCIYLYHYVDSARGHARTLAERSSSGVRKSLCRLTIITNYGVTKPARRFRESVLVATSLCRLRRPDHHGRTAFPRDWAPRCRIVASDTVHG